MVESAHQDQRREISAPTKPIHSKNRQHHLVEFADVVGEFVDRRSDDEEMGAHST